MSKASTVVSLRVPNELLANMPPKDRSSWVIKLIRENLNMPEQPDLESRVRALEEQIKALQNTATNIPTTRQHVIPTVLHKGEKKTTQTEREQLIRDCYAQGMDYKQTSDWLNEEGYLAQRGAFTPNSVRSIAKRLQLT
ncbi:hypothetical protein LRP52_48200 [Photobacterium sp. ZSDE20]|nr:hypothetical protein [Photobacterium sp. ZSDE20]